MTTKELKRFSKEVLSYINKSNRKSSVKAFVTCNPKMAKKLISAMFSVGISPESVIVETSSYMEIDKIVCSHESLGL